MTFWKRLGEQAVLVFAVGFLSVFNVSDLSTSKSAIIAGVAAVAQVVYGVLVKKLGDEDSPTIN